MKQRKLTLQCTPRRSVEQGRSTEEASSDVPERPGCGTAATAATAANAATALSTAKARRGQQLAFRREHSQQNKTSLDKLRRSLLQQKLLLALTRIRAHMHCAEPQGLQECHFVSALKSATSEPPYYGVHPHVQDPDCWPLTSTGARIHGEDLVADSWEVMCALTKTGNWTLHALPLRSISQPTFEAHHWSVRLLEIVYVLRQALVRKLSWEHAFVQFIDQQTPLGPEKSVLLRDLLSCRSFDECKPVTTPKVSPGQKPSGLPAPQAAAPWELGSERAAREIAAYANSIACTTRRESYLRGGGCVGQHLSNFGIQQLHVALVNQLHETGPYEGSTPHERALRILSLCIVSYSELVLLIEHFLRAEISFEGAQASLQLAAHPYSPLRHLRRAETDTGMYEENVLYFGARWSDSKIVEDYYLSKNKMNVSRKPVQTYFARLREAFLVLNEAPSNV